MLACLVASSSLRRWQDVFALLLESRDESLQPDVILGDAMNRWGGTATGGTGGTYGRLRITFNASLSASEKGQQWKMALQLLHEIHLAGKVGIRWVNGLIWVVTPEKR